MKKLRYTIFTVTIFLVLALSAMNTVPALADDSTPPPAETPTAETPPTEEVTDEAPPVEEIPVEETAPQEETVAALLTQVPEGTDVVVVNEEGETVPLATQEAAEIIANGDPQWCPAGVAPGAATCSGVKDSFNGANAGFDLIKWLVDNQPNKAGVIWIEAGYVGTANVASEGGPILLNGSSFATLDNFALTLNGGWTGTGSTLNPNTPSTFNVSLSITNWQGIITLNNLLFTGVTTGSASNNAALNVQTTKNVILNNVNTSNNTGASVKGVYIDNDEGTSVSSVTVNTSNLNGNNATGLTVFSDGIITLKDVTASNNVGAAADGIFLDNRAGTAVVGIIFSGATIASDNGYVGIEIYSDGAITASNLVANSNGSNGVFFDNRDAGTLGVTMSGSSNQFKFNGGTGVHVLSGGAITLNSVSVNNNGANGAYLDNGESTAGASVTLTGTNNFRENYSTGLGIYSAGVVTLSNITANDNGTNPIGGDGMSVDNSSASTPKAVTLTGFNQFNGNYGDGLMVLSRGAITISNLAASFNQIYQGAYLKNNYGLSPQNVTLTGTVNVNNNGLDGLYINTLGAISIGSITANGNSGSGVNLSNASGTAPKAVTLSGASNNFNGNNSHGLYITSLGAVTLNNVSASNNTNGFGLYVNNSWSGAAGGITLNGTSSFLLNGYSGIEMYSTGSILIKDLDVEENGILGINGDGHGVYLRNNYVGSTGSVTIGTNTVNWFNEFSSNFNSGLEIYSNGIVTLSNITASGNGLDNGVNTYGYGAYINNTSSSTPKAVTLLGKNEFNDNHNDGLRIATKGAIVLNKITANYNNGRGAFIANNANNLVPQNVTLNGYGNFLGNGDDGLLTATFGTIITNNLIANNNGQNAGSLGFGVWLDNCSYNGSDCNALTAKGVTLNGTNIFNNNHLDGLLVQSLGVIKANNVTASNNIRNGTVLNNGWEVGFFGVTLTGSNVFENNGVGGLGISSNGVISLSNISANGNFTGEGLLINTENLVKGPPNITMTGINTFNNNGGKGLLISSNGLVTLNNVTANGNGEEGAYINNFSSFPDRWYPFPANTINLLGVNNFNGNGLDGLYFYTYGGASINKITADDNGGDGVEGYSVERGITISCGSMTNNTGVGWRLGASTTITLKGVFTINNTAGPFVNLGGTLVTTRTC